jgi:putative transposase
MTGCILHPARHRRARLLSGWIDIWTRPWLRPMFLKRPEIADLVVEALRRGAVNRLYELAAFVVMSNHVHVLLRPIEKLTRILQLLKGATARQANEVLGRTGESFWQRESYDHWVRNRDEFGRILAYIENNPMKAGLVAEAAQYRWSSAWMASAN